MTTQAKDSPTFVDIDALPEIDGTTSVFDAFRQLNGAKRGAFAYLQDGQKVIVKANNLLDQLLVGQDFAALRDRTSWPLREAMRRIDATKVQVRVEDQPVTPSEDVQPLLNQTTKHAFLVTEGKRDVGWLFNDSSLFEIATKRLVYICANSHENPDPDHGTCYKCPAKIVSTQIK